MEEKVRLMTVKEVAERMNVSERFVRRLIFDTRIPYRKLGRHVRIDETDVEAFISGSRVEATA